MLAMMLVCHKVRTATGGLRIHKYTLHQCEIKLSLYLTCCIQKHVKTEIVSEVVGSQRTVLRKALQTWSLYWSPVFVILSAVRCRPLILFSLCFESYKGL